MKKTITAVILATSGLLITNQVFAAVKSETANFNVKINILSTCAVSAKDVVFNSINSNAIAEDKNGEITVTCTNQTPYTISFSNSSGFMTHESDSSSSIAYKLINKDKKEFSPENLESKTGTGVEQVINFTASVTGSTNVRAGLYTSAVTATVSY